MKRFKMMRISIVSTLLLVFTVLCATSQEKFKEEVWTFNNPEAIGAIAYNATGTLPAGAPAVSNNFPGVVFTGRYANYTKGDTWYPSWASDGNLYSPWTDGTIGDMPFVWSAKRDKAEMQ